MKRLEELTTVEFFDLEDKYGPITTGHGGIGLNAKNKKTRTRLEAVIRKIEAREKAAAEKAIVPKPIKSAKATSKRKAS